MVQIKRRDEDSFEWSMDWNYKWRDDKTRNDSPYDARTLDQKEILEFLRELHLARFKAARWPDARQDFSAIFGATVAVDYIYQPGIWDDRDIMKFLKAGLEIVPDMCPTCERHMIRDDNWNTFQMKCPECGKRGEELSVPCNMRSWKYD